MLITKFKNKDNKDFVSITFNKNMLRNCKNENYASIAININDYKIGLGKNNKGDLVWAKVEKIFNLDNIPLDNEINKKVLKK